MNITVLGAGAWGTALARLLAMAQHSVTLWGHDAGRLQEICTRWENARYLPGIALPNSIKLASDIPIATQGAEVVVIAIPSKAFRAVSEQLASFAGAIVSVTKGIEYETGLTMSGILRQTAPKAAVTALSGPSLAIEVARDIPTAVVVAAAELETATRMQALFHRPAFRVYTSLDVVGVELGGALKNVIAIAAGVCDGLGFGDNSKAALITRGIVEIRRLGVASGARSETFGGLSGLGDLTVTCFSRLSRNREFGERLGRGEKVEQILSSRWTVAEGYHTARAAHQLGQKLNIETPIVDEVYAMLYEHKNAGRAVRDLIARDSKVE